MLNMPSRNTIIVIFLFITTILATPALFATQKITGRWQGEINVDGQQISTAVGFRFRNEALTGTIDIRRMKGIMLEAVSYQPPLVHFEFESPVGKATVTAELDGDGISGKFQHSGGEGTVSLKRVVPVDIDGIISRYMNEKHIPGLAATIVRDGETVWTGTYGYANVAAEKPVTPQTIFLLASVSKTITATALMQLHAQGKFKLDDDVSDFLPFKLRNPGFPKIPITFAQLLRHRSSIRDDPEFYGPFWSEASGDPDTVLGEYLQSYLDSGGKQYNAEKNFFAYQPGADFNYCNTCYALLGYLVERISDRPYQDYSREVLFKPLGMKDAAWFYAGVDSELTAIPYHHDAEKGYEAIGIIGYPDWPAGQLRMSVTGLSRFLAAYTQNGKLDGLTYLDSSVIDLMTPKHQALGYYTWFSSSLQSTEDVLYTHGGGDIGTATLIGFNPATRNGFVILTNGEASITPLAAEIYAAMPTLGWE
jgi:CubicO group peptidase (beta-lactamase class C family)